MALYLSNKNKSTQLLSFSSSAYQHWRYWSLLAQRTKVRSKQNEAWWDWDTVLWEVMVSEVDWQGTVALDCWGMAAVYWVVWV
jgi:hypothetical protein